MYPLRQKVSSIYGYKQLTATGEVLRLLELEFILGCQSSSENFSTLTNNYGRFREILLMPSGAASFLWQLVSSNEANSGESTPCCLAPGFWGSH